MVRNRKRCTQQQRWSSENMSRAISAVKNQKMGYNTASKTYNVPRTTLKRRVLNQNKDAIDDKKVLGSYRPVFTAEQEEEILQHVLQMEQRFYGLTNKDVRTMAFELAEKNKITHPFNKEIGMAGEDWLEGFRKRHPQVTLRTPESTSIARAQGFNKVVVTKFFALLKNLMSQKNYPPYRIFNVDETAVSTSQAKNSKILALKGKRQVGAITSAERGVLCTAVICMSAGGTFVPPMIIFPRKRMKVELTDGAPPGCTFACSDSGWMKLNIFEQWFDHFLNFVKPTVEDPVLLVLDGHNTHTKNLSVIKKARANNVEILCLPPHCSHKLQPLDVSFNFPLNMYYVQSIEKFIRQNPGRVITQFQIGRLFGEAYLKTATPNTAINGFRRTGIYPCDMDIFSETEFAPSLTTDKPLHVDAESELVEVSAATLVVPATLVNPPIQDKPPTPDSLPMTDHLTIPHNTVDKPSTPENSPTPDIVPKSQLCPVKKVKQFSSYEEPKILNASGLNSPKAHCSKTDGLNNEVTRDNHFNTIISKNNFAVSPKDIRPLPKRAISTLIKKRKCGTTAILTSSPYKNELESELQKRTEKEKNKSKRETTVRNVFKNKKTKITAKKIKIKRENYVNKIKKKDDSSSEDDEEDPKCLYCEDSYLRSRKGEGWICCISCSNWAHDECAGVSDDDDDFVCEKCL